MRQLYGYVEREDVNVNFLIQFFNISKRIYDAIYEPKHRMKPSITCQKKKHCTNPVGLN
jgi:hypothetical protein